MSDSSFHSQDDKRDDTWRRWHMEELGLPQRAQREREQARRDAIRQQAFKRNAEIEALREQVREAARQEGRQAGHAEGYRAGYEQGMQEGRSAGEQEMQKRIHETLAPLIPLAQRFREALARLDEDIAADLVDLALATGRQLAGDALEARPEQVLTIVRELLHAEPALAGQPRLWLHPEDLELVRAHLGSELTAAGWKLHPDAQMTRGGCRATSPSGELDATWERRWQSIAEQIRQRQGRADGQDEAPSGEGGP